MADVHCSVNPIVETEYSTFRTMTKASTMSGCRILNMADVNLEEQLPMPSLTPASSIQSPYNSMESTRDMIYERDTNIDGQYPIDIIPGAVTFSETLPLFNKWSHQACNPVMPSQLYLESSTPNSQLYIDKMDHHYYPEKNLDSMQVIQPYTTIEIRSSSKTMRRKYRYRNNEQSFSSSNSDYDAIPAITRYRQNCRSVPDYNELPHVCNVCQRQFRRIAHLKAHAVVHSDGWKKFQCPECKKSYTKPGSLTLHMRKHIEQKQMSEYSMRDIHYISNDAALMSKSPFHSSFYVLAPEPNVPSPRPDEPVLLTENNQVSSESFNKTFVNSEQLLNICRELEQSQPQGNGTPSISECEETAAMEYIDKIRENQNCQEKEADINVNLSNEMSQAITQDIDSLLNDYTSLFDELQAVTNNPDFDNLINQNLADFNYNDLSQILLSANL